MFTTIVIYVARKVHTAYMFLKCFEACQVSELTNDLPPNERSFVAQRAPTVSKRGSSKSQFLRGTFDRK